MKENQMEQSNKYMVSVRCFTYNHAPYIVDAMDGFTKQKTTFPVVTLIVDDSSTDGEQDIIKKYLAEKFQVPYQTEETDDYQLICANHNDNPNCTFVVFLLKYNHYRIKKSKLPYIAPWNDTSKYHALCEGDDYWIAPNKLQAQVSFLESHPSYVMCHTAIKYYIQEEDRYLESKDININSKIINGGLTAEHILLGYRIQFCTVLYRQNAIVKARESDSYLFGGNFKMGDTQLWYQLYKEGDIYFYPEICAIYRKHSGSATMKTRAYDNLQFTLSSAELRMYFALRDNLSDAFCKYVQKWYSQSYIKCLAFNKSLSAKYPVNLKEDRLLYVLYKTHLLKPFLRIYMGIDPWLSTIKRRITGRM